MGIQLYGMTCGYLSMQYGFFLDGVPGDVAIPVSAFLIRHPKGDVIFDTGLETALQSSCKETVRTALGSMADYAVPRYLPGEEIAARLIEGGFDPARIDYLINSHLHMDHCGGNSMIPNANLVIQSKEWEAASTPEGQLKYHYNKRQYDLGHDRREVNGEHDLFGDGSIICIPTHGHTPGHQSLRVRLPEGDVVLTSDACYMRESMEQMRLPIPEVVGDPEQMLETFRSFKAFQDRGAQIIFGHDPNQWARLNSGPLKEITIEGLKAERSAALRSQ